MAYGTVNADVIGTSVAGSNLGAGNASIMKNRIINGAMMISQRSGTSSIALSNTSVYTVDRFAVRTATGSSNTAQQVSTAPTGFINSLKITTGTGANPAAGESNYIDQIIEGLNISDLAWGTASAKTITLSFQVYTSLTGTFGGALQNWNADRSYPFTYTVSSANTWTTINVTIAGDTTGTWLTTNSGGIVVYFDLGTGSTYQGTANSWAAADYRTATGCTKVVGTSGATFYITGVQLEVGSSATGFEYVNYQTSLANCQRYYEIKTFGPTGASYTLFGTYYNGSTYMGGWDFKQTKRASPTVTVIGTWVNATPTIVPAIDGSFFYTTVAWYLSGTASTPAISASAEL